MQVTQPSAVCSQYVALPKIISARDLIQPVRTSLSLASVLLSAYFRAKIFLAVISRELFFPPSSNYTRLKIGALQDTGI